MSHRESLEWQNFSPTILPCWCDHAGMWALHHLAAAAPADALAWHRDLLADTAVRMVSTADERVWPAAAPAACRLAVAVEGKVVPDWNYIGRKSPGGCMVSMAGKRVWPATAPTAWSFVEGDLLLDVRRAVQPYRCAAPPLLPSVQAACRADSWRCACATRRRQARPAACLQNCCSSSHSAGSNDRPRLIDLCGVQATTPGARATTNCCRRCWARRSCTATRTHTALCGSTPCSRSWRWVRTSVTQPKPTQASKDSCLCTRGCASAETARQRGGSWLLRWGEKLLGRRAHVERVPP